MAQTSLVGARILLYEKKNPDLLKLQVSVTLFSLESTNFLRAIVSRYTGPWGPT